MEDRPDLKFRRIHENVRYHFDFLFNRGFRITSATFAGRGTESWQAIMMAGNRIIRIHSDRGKVDLALSTLQLFDEIGLFDLDSMAQHVGQGKEPSPVPEAERMNEVQQLERVARLLEKYFDDIFAQFERSNFLIPDRLSFSDLLQQNRATVLGQLPGFFSAAGFWL